MRLVFSGAMLPVEISKEYVRTYEIENNHLFTRICASLISGEGEEAIEPYSIWADDDTEKSPSSSLLLVTDPLNLPWQARDLSGHLYERVGQLVFEDEEARMEIEALGNQISSLILRLTHQISGDYEFSSEWSVGQYLKAFSFAPSRGNDDSYLDSLLGFLDFASDVHLEKPLAFINLKRFLLKKELEEVFDRAFFLGIPLLLLENVVDLRQYKHEKKTCIDQHFLESF